MSSALRFLLKMINVGFLILALILRIQHMQIVWKCSALWSFRNAHIISCSILCSIVVIITVRNEVAKVMFLHVSVILSTGGGGAWSPGGAGSQGRGVPGLGGVCSQGVSALGGVPGWVGVLRGGAWSEGVSAPRGCIPACTEADPPGERRLLLRTVRILLECILVNRVVLL